MIDANMHYANAYLDELAREDHAQEKLARKEVEIHKELSAQCKTVQGAINFVAELDEPTDVLARLISGAYTVDQAIKEEAQRRAKAGLPYYARED